MLKRDDLIIMSMSSVLEHFGRESCRIKMKIPTGVTFDLDDTLWCGKTVLKKASKSLHGHLTSTYPRITPEVFQTHWTQVMAATESRDFSALRREALRQSAQSQNYDAETVVKSGMEAFLSARSSPDLFDGVEDMLSALQSRHLKLGVITNGNCQVKYLPSSLQSAFAKCWIAPETVPGGESKPHRAMFDEALSLLQLDAESVVHIGDDYACDVVGAKSVGMRTIWVTKDAVDPARYPHADAIVTHVTEALEVLDTWLTRR